MKGPDQQGENVTGFPKCGRKKAVRWRAGPKKRRRSATTGQGEGENFPAGQPSGKYKSS